MMKCVYTCPYCDRDFKVKFSTWLFAQHIFSKRKLMCPHCGVKSWVKPNK